MKPINNIEEIHAILLDLAKELHRICEKNNIRYYMAYGTLLGAVRHKGFIPWDDDMDFYVLKEDMEKLKDCLRKELPPHYGMLTMQDTPSMLFNFIKIEDKRTGMFEAKREQDVVHNGINIDIFPLDRCKEKSVRMRMVPFALALHNYRVMDVAFRSASKKLIAYIVKGLFFWTNKNSFYDFIEKYLVPKGDFYSCVFTTWINREIVPASWMDEREKIPFEDTEFYGIKKHDEYLTKCYGDYMQLPPVEQRHYHITKTFWK